MGSRRKDACEKATRTTLLQFCQDHEREIEYMVVRYYPVTDPEQPTWRNRIRRLQGWGQIENNPTLVATVKYLLALDSYLEDRLWNIIDCTIRAEEAEAKSQALEVQLENARAATAEAERRTNEVVKVLQKERKEHLVEVNKACKKC